MGVLQYVYCVVFALVSGVTLWEVKAIAHNVRKYVCSSFWLAPFNREASIHKNQYLSV